MKDFVDDLMGRLTLEEKIGQLTLYTADMDVTGSSVRDDYKNEITSGRVGSIFNAYTPKFTRELQDLAIHSGNKIPLIIGYDVIHGHKTIFPVSLGESCSWDMGLIEKTARISAVEATADGINWIYAPMVDVARDPRWGRVVEGAGEDAWLGAQVATARVRGIQGTSLANPDSALASVKHFAAYGAAKGGRDYNVVNMSVQELFETYLPPFKAAAEAGAATFMTSFNEINGVPSTSNKWLIEDVLRKQWKWDGFLVADYTAVAELIEHGTAIDGKDAARQAILAGTDVDMQSGLYPKYLAELVREGHVDEEVIEHSARRVLEAKYKLGLFKDPYRGVNEERAKNEIMKPEHLEHAAEVARHSIVLLKNEKATLPLRHHQTIALIGPMADNQRDQVGSWSAAGDWKKVTTLKAGLTKYISERSAPAKILYAKGANLIDDPTMREFLNRHSGNIELDAKSPERLLSEAVNTAKAADVIVLALGEAFGMSGEAASRTEIRLPANQQKLLRELAKLNKPIALVLFNGRPLVLTEESKLATSILETWYLGTEAGTAIADVLFGEHNPSGKLTMSFPYHEGQIPIYYGDKNTGRPITVHDKYASRYIDAPNTALYPFGWGLSYTKFEYSPLKLSANAMGTKDTLQASVTVTNAGDVDGTEIVQFYLRDLVGSTTRPKLMLKNFKKVYIKRGESQEVSFPITVEELKFYNEKLEYRSEAGAFRAFVGGNSRDLQSADFTLTE
jgi:beta-glucosidase